jgi:protoheme IX farnesyltransferase
MLPVVDPTGARTGQQALSHTLGLLPVSLCPFLFGLTGPVYLAGALVLGAGFIWSAWRFSRRIGLGGARRLFYASILYLPLLLSLIIISKR